MIRKFYSNFNFLLILLPLILITACGKDDSNEIKIAASSTAADEAQTAFIDVGENFIISFEEGTFSFTNTLSMDGKTGIVIRGAGRDKTFLDFSSQTSGGEGVLITNSNSIRFEDLTIRDAAGDALKASNCNKISFVNVGTVWSGEPGTDNGAYGLYPVLCTEVYIDNCYAYGASDAGIYVGQSDQVIMKNSVAEGNVAGIEIENTTNADVFNNEAFDNTGGILVFDLPGLTQYGSNVRVYNNNSHDNNRANFAPAGNIVGQVPAGTGCMILSTKNVEIFDNTFIENDFVGVLVASYLIFNDMPGDPNYQPLPAGIYIHDNAYTMTGTVNVSEQSDLVQDIIGLLMANSLDQPNILIDGLLAIPAALCIQESNASFINLNASDPTFMSIVTNDSAHDCTGVTLPAIVFEPY